MTALLTRLRIAGFKSFAEPAALDILPGLTGIVGPNGCGKSNVVEALRWAMGETSVRSLRGGEMDDVIFAGTSARASRNLAEVTITLSRGETALPDPFGAEDELQVTRRIERGAGSAYKANGREMRARDVQTLFADMASGAHSTAMVSQGRVSALVNAKPEARRQVLEEAAGITGLHARRHEAELKLRAAESNLTKAEDLRAQLEASRESLRKQARQATRYRNISGLVRGAETEFLAVQHGRATVALAAARQAQAQAEQAVAEADAARIGAAEAVAAAEAALPGPREAEAASRSTLERRRLEAETLNEDAARALRAYEDAAARLAQIESDLEDAGRLEADAMEAAAQLQAEADALSAQLAALPAQAEAAAREADAARRALLTAEHVADAAAGRAAEAAAAARQAVLAEEAAAARVEAAEAAIETARRARDAAKAALADPAVLTASDAAVAASEQALAEISAAALAAEARCTECAAAAAHESAAYERAASQAREAEARLHDAASRETRLAFALAKLEAETANAEAALVDPSSLRAARQAAAEAAALDAACDQAVRDAEQAHLAAGTMRLDQCRQRDALRTEHARLNEAAVTAATRRARLETEAGELALALAAASKALVPAEQLAACAAAAAQAAVAAEDAAASLQHATDARASADAALATSRGAAATAAADAARLRAEAEGLLQALAGQQDEAASLLDRLAVPAGLEAAVGAAFAQAAGSLDECAPIFWRELPMLEAPVLPGATPLAALMDAPAALGRLFGHTLLLAEGQDGAALQGELPPGCVVVSAAGDVWRWDGHVMRSDAPNAAAARLRQRARLAEVQAAQDGANRRAGTAGQAAQDAERELAYAAEAEVAARAALQEAAGRLTTARQDEASLTAEAERATQGLLALRPAEARLAAELAQAQAAHSDAVTALAALADADAAAQAASDAETRAEAAAAALDQARAARNDARAAAEQAAVRLRLIETAAAEAESVAASLRPQLARLTADLAEARHASAQAREDIAALPDMAAVKAHAEAAQAALEAAAAALTEARAAEAAAHARQRDAAAEAAKLHRAHIEASHALAARETLLASAEADLERARAALAAAREAAAQLPDAAMLAETAAQARAALGACRNAQADATAAYGEMLQAQSAAQSRAPALAQELLAWQGRAEEASRRRFGLATRHATAAEEAASLADAPALLANRAAASGDALAQAEATHEAAAAALRDAEHALRAASQAQRDGDAAFAACREVLARGEGALETAAAALAGVLANAAERLGADAELPAMDDADEAAEDRARRKLERLQRERDEMGPVNLRADIELEEITSRIDSIDRDRDELTTAIAKLRGSIGHLNREGRERLTTVFTEVDKHFRTLFTRMMGGGRAHLALTGSDDPLLAGLEIYAEPPGKKLSTLSLLSGGEQALTALSLIFAVFRCTPAPIAVLDEVDAPLDDANVDRFCSLLEDVVHDTGTRFLVVTHHQLTMSRMDRLYGVTMQERGVSRLLSVDLRRAAEMVEPALQAAE
jgi:chromosome segregation protein